MKKRFGLKVLAFAALALVMTACNKYEEGANFSLRSAKNRLVNNWTMATYTVDGTSVLGSGNTFTWDIKKDGSATITVANSAGSVSDDGSWAFNGDKTQLILTDLGLSDGTYDIIMLKNKDLKLRQTETIFTAEVVSEWTFTGE